MDIYFYWQFVMMTTTAVLLLNPLIYIISEPKETNAIELVFFLI